MEKIIRATSSGRLQISLIDLHGYYSNRVDGSIGLSILEPTISFLLQKQDQKGINVSNSPKVSIDEELLSDIKKTLQNIQQHYKLEGVSVKIEKALPLHSGFGSKTQALLTASGAYCKLYGVDYDYREMAQIVGRGGTSGIGVEAFVSGGFIVDCGHSFQSKNNTFKCSAYSKHITPAPLVGHYHAPDWPILIITPNIKKQFFGNAELEHWNKNCPIPLSDVQACSHIALMMLIPSIIEKNLDVFCDGVNKIQNLAWKRSLIDAQSPVVRKTMEFLSQIGLQGVGLSSAGATIYALGPVLEDKVSSDKILLQVQEYLSENGGGTSFITKPNNFGAKFEELKDFN